MSPSLTSDWIIQRAEECFALDLIDQQRLEKVTRLALTQPGYDPILDLPFSHEVERERLLRKKAARRSTRHRILNALRLR